MGLLSFLGAHSPAHIYWLTFLSRARRIGRDGCGNTYYQAGARKGYNHPRRWVIYNGSPEPSTVPPEWHGWLHYQTDVVPGVAQADNYRRAWQKPPVQNLTGTDQAYLPPGHILRGFKRDPSSTDYQAWTPPETTPTTPETKAAGSSS